MDSPNIDRNQGWNHDTLSSKNFPYSLSLKEKVACLVSGFDAGSTVVETESNSRFLYHLERNKDTRFAQCIYIYNNIYVLLYLY